MSHIYGHGNARRGAWLHADPGNGDVLELVSAVSQKPGLDVLPPMPFLRIRVDGRDGPRGPLPALLWRSGLGTHRRLGRNISLHPALGLAGRFGEPVVAWEGVLQSAANGAQEVLTALPSCPAVNPQVSIMAVALAIADRIIEATR